MKPRPWLLAGTMALAACPAFAQNRVQYTAPDGVNAVNVTAATPLPTGKAAIASASFNTPSGTTAYAIGDLVANSGTAGSVSPMQFSVCRDTSGATGMIRRVRVKTTDTGFAGATVRVHFYKSSPTSAVGDNGAYATTESDWIGDVDVILDHAFSDPLEKGIGVPAAGSEINYDCNSGVAVIYGLIETRTAATPQGAKAWIATVEALPN